jgi:hypothetical protein
MEQVMELEAMVSKLNHEVEKREKASRALEQVRSQQMEGSSSCLVAGRQGGCVVQ